MQEYRRALALDPTLGKAEVNLGTLLARAGRLDEARVHLERGVALDPLSVIGMTNLGQLEQLQGRSGRGDRALPARARRSIRRHATARRFAAALLRETGETGGGASPEPDGGALTPPSTPVPGPPPDPSAGP